MKVAENPHVDVIGHCGRGNYPFDHEKVIRAFKEYGKIVEINNATLQKSANHAACTDIARVCKRLEVPVWSTATPLRRQNRRVRPGGGAAGGSGFSKEADYQRGHRPL